MNMYFLIFSFQLSQRYHNLSAKKMLVKGTSVYIVSPIFKLRST
jgi:hypothetical protein